MPGFLVSFAVTRLAPLRQCLLHLGRASLHQHTGVRENNRQAEASFADYPKKKKDTRGKSIADRPCERGSTHDWCNDKARLVDVHHGPVRDARRSVHNLVPVCLPV